MLRSPDLFFSYSYGCLSTLFSALEEARQEIEKYRQVSRRMKEGQLLPSVVLT